MTVVTMTGISLIKKLVFSPPNAKQQNDDDQDIGNRINDIDDPHHHIINLAAEKTGHRAVADPDDQRNDRRDDPTIREIRPPCKTLARRSRPASSVPIQC